MDFALHCIACTCLVIDGVASQRSLHFDRANKVGLEREEHATPGLHPTVICDGDGCIWLCVCAEEEKDEAKWGKSFGCRVVVALVRRVAAGSSALTCRTRHHCHFNVKEKLACARLHGVYEGCCTPQLYFFFRQRKEEGGGGARVTSKKEEKIYCLCDCGYGSFDVQIYPARIRPCKSILQGVHIRTYRGANQPLAALR